MQKSEYRDAAAEVAADAGPGDALVLEGPRQQLLAKYYMPPFPLYTVPEVELPEFWPVNAPPVVPEQEDGRLRDILAAHEHVWLVLAGEDEVDKGEFVRRYLGAVSYGLNCRLYVAVELCRYVAPDRIAPGVIVPLDVQFGDALRLQGASAGVVREGPAGSSLPNSTGAWRPPRRWITS